MDHACARREGSGRAESKSSTGASGSMPFAHLMVSILWSGSIRLGAAARASHVDVIVPFHENLKGRGFELERSTSMLPS